MHAVERWTLGLGAIFSLVAFLCFGLHIGLSVSLGAGIMILNSFAMRRVGEKIFAAFRAESGARPLRAVVLFNLKMGALLFAVYCAVKFLHVEPIALLVGLSIFPLAAVAVALTVEPQSTASVEDHHG
jgi:hypothetical protein